MAPATDQLRKAVVGEEWVRQQLPFPMRPGSNIVTVTLQEMPDAGTANGVNIISDNPPDIREKLFCLRISHETKSGNTGGRALSRPPSWRFSASRA